MGYFPCYELDLSLLIIMIKHSYIFLYTDQDVCVAGEKKLALLEKELLEEHVCLQFFPLFFSRYQNRVNTSNNFLVP